MRGHRSAKKLRGIHLNEQLRISYNWIGVLVIGVFSRSQRFLTKDANVPPFVDLAGDETRGKSYRRIAIRGKQSKRNRPGWICIILTKARHLHGPFQRERFHAAANVLCGRSLQNRFSRFTFGVGRFTGIVSRPVPSCATVFPRSRRSPRCPFLRS